MKIETKYDIGEKVWIIDENKIVTCRIESIQIDVEKNGPCNMAHPKVSYILNEDEGYFIKEEYIAKVGDGAALIELLK